MSSLQRVVWSEGMLMSPHHLQLSDAYHEQSLAASLRMLAPPSFGVSELSLSDEALAAGSVAVARLSGIMPSGLCFSLSENELGCPAARPVQPFFGPNQQTLEVYLAVPRARDGVSNVSADSHQRSRFVARTDQRFDFTEGGNEQTVTLASPRACLLFGGESRDDYESLKVAEVVRTGSGQLAFSTHFVPPCLRIGASRVVMRGLERLLATMGAKAREVRSQLSVRGQASVEYGASEVTRFLLLHALNGQLPWVRHACETGDVAGRGAHLALSELVGQLCSFVGDADPLSVPVYRHEDAGGSFVPLFERLDELLRGSVASRHVAVALTGRDDGVHFGELSDAALLEAKTRFVLGVSSAVRAGEVQATVQKLGKLGSWADIQRLVSSATTGIPLTPVACPSEIPARPGHVYFGVGTENAYWENVIRERKVALYLPPPLQGSDVRVTLFGIV